MPKLKTFRILCNLTQQQMADILKIKRTTYVQKEAGRVDFTTTQVNIILKTFKEKGHEVKYEDIFMVD